MFLGMKVAVAKTDELYLGMKLTSVIELMNFARIIVRNLVGSLYSKITCNEDFD